ncbi:HAD-IIB family hydrolase [bacterium]|nr:HAD-IIB family hydrolase [bacterium]
MLKLICTDLDRTLIPNGDQPESPGARDRFAQLVSDNDMFLTYVTGRDQASVKEAIATFRLPVPDFVIADVGTSIIQVSNASWNRVTEWDERLAKSWAGGESGRISELLLDMEALQLQDIENQKPHKLSYYVQVDNDIDAIIGEIGNRLKRAGIRTNIIWSIDPATRTGLLDILPDVANKRKAIEFLMDLQGFSLDNTLFSGDSGNDLDVLISPIKSVLVANADPETREKVRLKAGENMKRVYIASGMGTMNGNYSAGILEGIYHYFPALKDQ